MRCIPGASHRVCGPLVKAPGGVSEFLHFLAIVPLAVVITLPVDTAAQASLRNQTLVQFPLFPQLQLLFVILDFVGQRFRHLAGELFFPNGFEAFIPNTLQKNKTHRQL